MMQKNCNFIIAYSSNQDAKKFQIELLKKFTIRLKSIIWRSSVSKIFKLNILRNLKIAKKNISKELIFKMLMLVISEFNQGQSHQ